MRTRLFLLALLLPFILFPIAGHSQEKKEFRFYFIMKNRYSSTSDLAAVIKEEYYYSVDNPNHVAIFYMPNPATIDGEYVEPTIVNVNTPGGNKGDIQRLLNDLFEGSHEVDSDKDCDNVLRILSENDFVDNNGFLKYDLFEMYIYVTPDYDLKSGFIERLYFSLELDKLRKDEFLLKILHDEESDFQYDESHPFGTWNICNNNKIYSY